MLRIFKKAKEYKNRIAVKDKDSSYSYKDLTETSDEVAYSLLSEKADLNEERIGFLISPSFKYLTVLWGIWKAGGIAVPISISATESELTYYLKAVQIKKLILDKVHLEKFSNLSTKINIHIEDVANLVSKQSKSLPEIKKDRRAMILFTSGTTNKPKGVVSTHENIEAQIKSLVKAWEWDKNDSIPLILPLHHIHGIINSLSCPLWAGAKVDILGRFEADKVIEKIINNNYSVFTAVPTIYFSLIDVLQDPKNKNIDIAKSRFREMRLIMSGSAALAPEIHKKWKELTGQDLLERYGMTEIGMALSNPLHGEKRAGSVGQPLPNVEMCLMEEGKMISEENKPGEIMIKGPQVFLEYWNRTSESKDSFFEGWFKTGDIAELSNGYYKILGRESVDIIKTGGYKISALEIEDTLLKHPSVKECAVIGIEDPKWGEIVAAAITSSTETTSLKDIQSWSKNYLSAYKIPRKLIFLEELPKNAMGKVVKKDLRDYFK